MLLMFVGTGCAGPTVDQQRWWHTRCANLASLPAECRHDDHIECRDARKEHPRCRAYLNSTRKLYESFPSEQQQVLLQLREYSDILSWSQATPLFETESSKIPRPPNVLQNMFSMEALLALGVLLPGQLVRRHESTALGITHQALH